MPRDPPSQEHRSSPYPGLPLVAAVVLLVVSTVMRRILEKEEGAVMQERGVPSLSPFRSHDSYRFAYNSALQNDLFQKNMSPFQCREVENN